MFYDNPDFVNATHTTMQALTKIALIDEWENELHNDLPSFIKSAFAWDELIGYGSIDDKIQYEETPVKVVRDFFLKEKVLCIHTRANTPIAFGTLRNVTESR